MSKRKVLSKFMILCWAIFAANLSYMRPPAMGWTPLNLYHLKHEYGQIWESF